MRLIGRKVAREMSEAADCWSCLAFSGERVKGRALGFHPPDHLHWCGRQEWFVHKLHLSHNSDRYTGFKGKFTVSQERKGKQMTTKNWAACYNCAPITVKQVPDTKRGAFRVETPGLCVHCKKWSPSSWQISFLFFPDKRVRSKTLIFS